MHRQQRGMTLISFILLAVLIGAVAYAGLRLAPVYGEYMTLSSVMNSVKTELDGQGATPVAIRNALERRLAVESVSSVGARDFDISQSATGYVVALQYEGRAPYAGNLFLVASFDRQVEIRR
jgi:hypothetical protein